MATAIDASTTIVANGASVSSTATTASFNAPAKSLILACVAANANTSAATTVTITNNGTALTWTLVGIANFSTISGNGMAAIYGCYISSARSGLTVTATTAGSTSSTRRPSIRAMVVTGAHDTNWLASTGNGTSTTNNRTASFTQTVANSMLIVAASEWQKLGTPTSSDLTIATLNQAGADGVDGFFGYRQLDSSLNTENYNLDAAGTSTAAWNYVRLEVAPALAPTTGAGSDVGAHQINTEFSRTGTESANGDSITSRSWTIVSGPTGVGSTLSTAAALSWTPSVAGSYVLRYSATNGIGTGTDDVSVTVTALAPTVNAGADAAILIDDAFARTATEDDGGATITAREWKVLSGPAEVGNVLATTAAINWTPSTVGDYILQYKATNSTGDGTDTVAVEVVFPVGVPFLERILGPDARVGIELAWGADLTADPDTWEWTDITTDVRYKPAISMKLGRGNEAATSQPASCKFTVANGDASYSLGGMSPNWPNVKRSVPCRVTIDPGTATYSTLFQGYVDTFTPTWDSLKGNLPVVEIEASGLLRRLGQGQSPVLSAYRRAYTSRSNTVAYWPMEDDKGATGASGANGAPSGVVEGVVNFGTNTDFDAASSIPTFKNGSITLDVPNYTFTGAQQVRMLVVMPDTLPPDGTVLFRVFTAGSVYRWDFIYETDKSLRIGYYFGGPGGGAGVTSGVDYSSRFIGKPIRWGLELKQSGSDVIAQTHVYPVGSSTAGFFNHTVSSVTLGRITQVVILPNQDVSDISIGHVTVQDEETSVFEAESEIVAYNGEYPTTNTGRLVRLTDENEVSLTRYTGSLTSDYVNKMGSQLPKTLLELLRECEVSNQGMLWDGRDDGLSYSTYSYIVNRDADIVIDVSQKEMSDNFTPIADDQRTRNKVTVKRPNGGSVTIEDADGPMGTQTIGIYDTSLTVSKSNDEALAIMAGHILHVGTIEDYRYPTVTIDLVANPDLIPTWLSLVPGMRVDLINISSVMESHLQDTVSLVIEGIEQKLTPHTWVGELKCSPAEAYQMIELADTTGDTNEFIGHLDTDSSELQSSASSGASSLSVKTNDGPLWTTNSDDFPFQIEVGGIPITVTAISGASSPQTFAVTGSDVLKDLAAGLAVEVYKPHRLGL